MLFGDSTGQAVLDEIVGERHIPGQRTRIPTSRGTGGARRHQTTHLDRGNAKARVSATTKADWTGISIISCRLILLRVNSIAMSISLGVRNRRILPVSARPGEGPLPEPITGVRQARRELVFMPHFGHRPMPAWLIQGGWRPAGYRARWNACCVPATNRLGGSP